MLRRRAASPCCAHWVTSCSLSGQCVATDFPPAPQNKTSIPSFEWPNDNGALNCVAAAKTRFVVSSITTNENLCLPLNSFKYAFNASDRSRRSACSSRIASNFFPTSSAPSVSLTSASSYELPLANFTLCVIDRANPPHSRRSTL